MNNLFATNFYDVSVSCLDESDSVFCFNDNQLCGMSSLSKSFLTCDYLNNINRYNCAPGDLSGKFGEFIIDPHGSKLQTYEIVDYIDDLMIDLSLIDKHFGVLQCKNTLEIIQSGLFEPVFE